MKLDLILYDNYFKGYMDKVIDKKLKKALTEEGTGISEFINRIPEQKAEYRYDEGKWTVKEVLMHLLDCERIMAYRALSFARGDKTELPGFDEKQYGPNSNASSLSLSQIKEANEVQRRSTLQMFESFTEEMMDLQGKADGILLSARALAYIIAGHAYHHREILNERYMN